MAVTPDKVDVILSIVLEIRDKLNTVTTNPPPSDDTNEFKARWKPLTAEEFKARWGKLPGEELLPMGSYDETEAIFRARAFYATNGKPTKRFTNHDAVVAAVNVIAEATAETATSLYEYGYGKASQMFPDTLAYGFYTGILDTQEEYQKSLGAGTQPMVYAGVTLEHLLAPNFGGGGPSGG